MDKLSDNLKLNDQSVEGNKSQIYRFIRDSKPEVEVQNSEPVISGDSATITSPVRLKMNFLGQSFDQTIPNVTMIFRKEDARDWLIFPTRQWRLQQVLVPPGSLPGGLAP